MQHEKSFWSRLIREWLDIDAWKEHYPNFYTCSTFEQEEIKRAIHEDASCIFLRV